MSAVIATVGGLRRALEGLPDDRIIVCQVVGQDGSAWNLFAKFVGCVPQGDIAAIILDHPAIKTLPEVIA